MERIIIYTDGGARNNPGPAGAGVVVYEGDPSTGSGHLLAQVKKYLGSQTNNWAEYEAVALALEEAQKLGLAGREVEIRMDSKLVVEQLSGNWKIKEPTLKPQAAKVRALLAHFPNARFTYIPREENAEADALVNEAIDEAT
ncbi:hypothetical protein A3C18_03255 [Candidatus Kaiserbacteria bacterium RIFCSPHIGHO2_02_FULL_54_11b]|uniref:RNase H type-1 domain-containing protein n=2 Tax=Candidatus Kaiseribacteriota TaxID=1752734 RepID=A0A1F6CQT0_9BACT|nr:MAG: hypothetical protein A2704_02125 [Candidatus Kaiserbacteria bacterium RIFCSPHIGHO2_01_FULL_54_36b]OGG64489.1 MAG: hypothetical protein A3C18_03255 [Candidatus Kaiserbacteria bacterium RIFCSPHIGHO2_02_FULL_54_11b]